LQAGRRRGRKSLTFRAFLQNLLRFRAFHPFEPILFMHRTCLLALLLSAPLLPAEPLSQADREALIEKLDTLRDNAREKAMTKIGAAAAAFRAGMASDEAAVKLYLECTEKVEFQDRQRSSQEFREWKRRQDDRLKDEGLRRSLRHQLRWLVLSLEAAEAGEKRDALAPRAAEAVDAIFANPEQFGGNVGSLSEPVTNTVFARAYNLGGAKLEDWPLSPLEVSAVFNQIIFPPLRQEGKFDSLREQWLKRIRYEGVAREHWSGSGEGRGKDDERSPAFEKFIVETLPDLRWQMEEDLFKAGDQQRAAINMLAHIEANVTHSKARDWAESFRVMVDPPKVVAPGTADAAKP
jgi:hypothetical protein